MNSDGDSGREGNEDRKRQVEGEGETRSTEGKIQRQSQREHYSKKKKE